MRSAPAAGELPGDCCWASQRLASARCSRMTPCAPSCWMLPCRPRAMAGFCSTMSTRAAPREAASKPRAPLPANRSMQRQPLRSCPSQLNRVSRTRSGVGRRPGASGTGSRRRFHWPPMMRMREVMMRILKCVMAVMAPLLPGSAPGVHCQNPLPVSALGTCSRNLLSEPALGTCSRNLLSEPAHVTCARHLSARGGTSLACAVRLVSTRPGPARERMKP